MSFEVEEHRFIHGCGSRDRLSNCLVLITNCSCRLLIMMLFLGKVVYSKAAPNACSKDWETKGNDITADGFAKIITYSHKEYENKYYAERECSYETLCKPLASYFCQFAFCVEHCGSTFHIKLLILYHKEAIKSKSHYYTKNYRTIN